VKSLNPLCFICPHREELKTDPDHECHITKAIKHLIRKFRRKRRNSLEAYQAAIQEIFVERFTNHTANLLYEMFRHRKEYGRIVLEKALRKLK